MRHQLVALGATVAAVFPAPAARAPVPVVVVEGRGWGHGVGMAQDGALAMGRQGASTQQILNQFYPGTRVGRAGGEVRVSVLQAGDEATVVLPGGGEVRDARGGSSAAGFPVKVAVGGSVRIRVVGGRFTVVAPGARFGSVAAGTVGGLGPAGRFAATTGAAAQPAPTTTSSTVPPLITLPDPAALLPPLTTPPLLLPPTTATSAPATTSAPAGVSAGPAASGPLWIVPAGGGAVEVPARKQRYRGVIEATGGGGALRLVDHVDVEQYLRGMGEVRDPGWPQAALRAQAIAARTYALRAVGGGGELCDDQRCQVYLGTGAEYGAMDRAVSATRGQVVVYGRGLASAVYSANGGGVSATTEEGFGTPGTGYPYLRAAPYPTGDPMNWTVRVALRDVGRRLGYRGTVTGLRATATGMSGRVLRVTIEGGRGIKAVTGIDFDRALGLRSTFFSLRTELAATAPAPPPPSTRGPVQLLPEQAGGSGAAPAEVVEVVDDAADAGSAVALGPPAPAAAVLAGTGVDASPAPRLALSALAWLGLVGVVCGLVASSKSKKVTTPP